MNNKNALFGGKKFLFRIESKETKANKQKTKQKKGGFRAKWGGPFGHLTWPKTLPKKSKKQKQKKQKNKEGLVPSEVALWATSPDPSNKNKNKKQEQTTKTTRTTQKEHKKHKK